MPVHGRPRLDLGRPGQPRATTSKERYGGNAIAERACNGPGVKDGPTDNAVPALVAKQRQPSSVVG
jgi:hypothetical protein